MSMNFSFDHMRGSLRSSSPARPEPQAPFRVLLVGDFSARASRNEAPALSGRSPLPADIDTFDALFSRLAPRVALATGTDHAAALAIASLDDFHPDAIYRRVDVFEAMRTLRARLMNPATSAAAAAEIRASAAPAASAIVEPKPMEAPATPHSEFEALLGERRAAKATPASSMLDALIRDLVAPHVVPAAADDLPALVATVDAAIASAMRRILRDPAFAALESTWRAVHECITRLELSEDLTLSVLDATRADLAADLATNGGQHLSRILVEGPRSTAGGHPFSLICLLDRLGASDADAALAGGLAVVAAASGAALLADACPSLLGVSSLASSPRPEQWTQPASEAWSLVRSLPEAASLGLVLPRPLARLPYGAATDAIDAFAFEERLAPTDAASAADRAAGLPFAFAAPFAAITLARQFTDNGWMLDAGSGGEVESLPVLIDTTGPDRHARPTAEAFLTDSAANALLDRGLIPLVSIQHRDAARIPRLVSVRGTKLAASWA